MQMATRNVQQSGESIRRILGEFVAGFATLLEGRLPPIFQRKNAERFASRAYITCPLPLFMISGDCLKYLPEEQLMTIFGIALPTAQRPGPRRSITLCLLPPPLAPLRI